MRNEDRYIDFDEYMASLDMERQKKIRTESAIAIRKIEAQRSKKLEKQRKRDINAQFWHSIKSLVFVISCAAIAVYTLIHFA